MVNQNKIFKKGSKTFFYSSLFFPKKSRKEVEILYAFVRIPDDFVDQVPSLKKEFYQFKDSYYRALSGEKSNFYIIDDFVALQKKYDFNQDWIDAFFRSMEWDLEGRHCKNMVETEQYMHGSASVIGFMMCKMFDVKKEGYFYAEKLSQGLQYINFIRDIDEDNILGRQYLPQSNLDKYDLKDLSQDSAFKNKENFSKFLRSELDYFDDLIKQGLSGVEFLPKSYRFPIKTAVNLYIYTAKKIYKDPSVVYQKKIKPSIFRIFFEALRVIF